MHTWPLTAYKAHSSTMMMFTSDMLYCGWQRSLVLRSSVVPFAGESRIWPKARRQSLTDTLSIRCEPGTSSLLRFQFDYSRCNLWADIARPNVLGAPNHRKEHAQPGSAGVACNLHALRVG